MSNVETKKSVSPRKTKKENGPNNIDLPDAATPVIEV
jgi:hypothetical protein